MTIDELLVAFDGPVQSLARELCGVIRGIVPEAEERVYPGWRGVGYRLPGHGYVFGVFPRQASVRLLFEHGRTLPDPCGELQGSGSQTRYLEFSPHGPLPEDVIARFIGRALRA